MKRASFKIGSILNIPIYLHFSLFLILPILALSYGSRWSAIVGDAEIQAMGLITYFWGLLVGVALFGSVLLHELGHAYAALRQGIRTRDITLMLFGGVARLEDMPTRWGQEAKIALAGPAVSVAIGLGCLLMRPLADLTANPNLAASLFYVGTLNLFLCAFNLLPAFPMDGGRVLRSLLARRRSFVHATRIAARVGKTFAVAFGIFGLLYGNFFLLLIAFFVYQGASQEQHFSAVQDALDGLRVRDLMTPDVATVAAETPIATLIDRMMQERHSAYPVVEDGKLVGWAG